MRPALVAIIVLLAGCVADEPASPTPAGTPTTPQPTPTRAPAPTTPTLDARDPNATVFGVSLSPKSYSATDFPAFFVEAQSLGSLILWGGQAHALADETSAAHAVAALAKQEGFLFAAQVDFNSPNQPFDDARQAQATRDVVAYVTKVRPAYMILGVEVDRHAAKDPAYVDALASWYDGAYDAVKHASPATLVFPSFQLESIAGYTGGLFGGPERSEPRWDLLAKFPKRDLTAFTTYPGLVFQNASAIPEGYYQEAAARAGGPIGFTEVGHFVDLPDAPGWESSAREQGDLVKRFLKDAQALEARLAVWLHVFDQPSVEVAPFRTMGLISQDGTYRTSHHVWAAYAAG